MIHKLKVFDYELTFKPIWSPGASRPITPRVDETEFADGFTQVVRDGLNDKRRKYSLALESLTLDEWAQVDEFLQSNAIEFLIRPPMDDKDPDDMLGRLIKVRATKFSPSYQRGGLVNGVISLTERF